MQPERPATDSSITPPALSSAPVSAPVSAPAPAGSPALGLEPHLFDRFAVIYKYRWASIGVFLLVVGWVMIDSYTSIPMYRATARVLIEDPGADVATPTEIARSITLQDPEIYMETQLRIIKGRELSQHVAPKLDLAKVPEFNGQGPKPTPLARTITLIKFYVKWPYRLITSGGAIPTIAPVSTQPLNPADFVDALSSRLNASRVRGTQLVEIYYESADANFAAKAAN